MTAAQSIRPFKTNRYGFSLKAGKFYFFDKRQVVVMKGWPGPMAWRRTTRIPWHPTRQHASPVLAVLLARMKTAGDAIDYSPDSTPEENERIRKAVEWERHVAATFFAPLPSVALDTLMPLVERQWNVFSLLARCPGAMDLAVSNPALCFALASCWAFHQPAPAHPLREVRRMVRKKQKDILGWLGFPATESARRILARVSLADVTVSRLFNLRRALGNQVLSRTLAHLPRLPGFVLDVVGTPWLEPLMKPAFLHEVVSGTRVFSDQDLMTFLKDTMWMSRQQERPLVNGFASVRQLIRVHDELAGGHQGYIAMEHMPETLPPPPFDGTEDIVPLSTPADVIREGREMNNCCASYLAAIAQGHRYLYRVEAPVRATLEIVREGMRWVPGQLMKEGNQPVEQATRYSLFNKLLLSSQRSRNPAPEMPGQLNFEAYPPAAGLLGQRLHAAGEFGEP